MTKTSPVPSATTVRITTPIEAELVYINLLSTNERRDALVAAGRVKQRLLDETLRQTVIGRVRNGEIPPQRIDPLTGQTYPDLDWKLKHPNDNGEVINVGRVPGYPEYYVYRAADQTLWFFSPQQVQERMEATRAEAVGAS